MSEIIIEKNIIFHAKDIELAVDEGNLKFLISVFSKVLENRNIRIKFSDSHRFFYLSLDEDTRNEESNLYINRNLIEELRDVFLDIKAGNKIDFDHIDYFSDNDKDGAYLTVKFSESFFVRNIKRELE